MHRVPDFVRLPNVVAALFTALGVQERFPLYFLSEQLPVNPEGGL